jgi:acylphosphatase
MTKAYAIIVSGRVQGVFYRASTHQKASELGLKGFVRNEPNGDVYIEAEGDEQVVQNLISWCKQGPPRARVDHVDVKEIPVKGYDAFEVRR